MSSTKETRHKMPPKRFKLSREGFAKISAVEGIYLDADMIADFAEFDRMNLSPAERREVIARKYGKTRI